MFEEEILGARSWLIGLTDQGHEGRWIWQHSVSDVVYSGWAPGYPRNDHSQDDCAVLSSLEGYKWTDVRLVLHSLRYQDGSLSS